MYAASANTTMTLPTMVSAVEVPERPRPASASIGEAVSPSAGRISHATT
jgi:hypothetical protein